MTAAERIPRLLIPIGILIGAGAAAYLAYDARREVTALREEWARAEGQLKTLNAEVTRMRIEQSTEGRGVHAILEKLEAYAPLLTSAAVAKPDYAAAEKEMQAILRATESLGVDAFEPLQKRFLELPADQFDARKWLLEAMLRADPGRGKAFVRKVLHGYHRDVPVSPRLRWYAADLLIRIDPELARVELRTILQTESSRGINPDRAAAYGIPVPDSSIASSGFHNFIGRYVRTNDPECIATLLMVLGRSEHDLVTVQECVKELGHLKAEKAVPAIEKLYKSPPAIRDNPLFLNHCLDALVEIQGAGARPFLEKALRNATNELVANKIKHLLQQLS
ncbi:MAG: hypothetical protein Fur0037_27160 [Planctomycetota bacterium]